MAERTCQASEKQQEAYVIYKQVNSKVDDEYDVIDGKKLFVFGRPFSID